MTQFKHTPGPWEILNWDGCFEIVCGENLNPLTVCVIENRHRDIYCINPEANAKLIAAAPELLEALTEYVNLEQGHISKLTTTPRRKISKSNCSHQKRN